MNKEVGKKKMEAALRLGYALSHTDMYYSYLRRLDKKELSEQRDRVEEIMGAVDAYYEVLFGKGAPPSYRLKTQDHIKRYFKRFSSRAKASVELRYGGNVASAFRLGSLLGINVVAPPPDGESINLIRDALSEFLEENTEYLRMMCSPERGERAAAHERVIKTITARNIEIGESSEGDEIERVHTQHML